MTSINWVGHKCSCHNQHVYMDVQVEILRRFSGIIFTCEDSVEAFSLLFNFSENIQVQPKGAKLV